MATVSHNAMRRYPVGSADGNQSSQHYYVASSQQLSSKRTWSQRLRISKPEKFPPSSITDISSELSGGSTLSRSMKYAEPWLYGTVRGIPARPVHGQPIFAHIPAEVAVVVCSCPEYLSGTKREIKKASICKKCKGSRLPLAPIGGTVRITSTTVPLVHKGRTSAGTMRLPTTSSMGKVRPSILDPQNDPYDLMRRTRLLSPETKSPSKSNDRNIRARAKSTSPTRGRSRNRLKPAPPPPSPLHVMDEILPVKNNRQIKIISVNKQQDCWLDTLEADHSGRRSILHYDVNPYDLISSNISTHMNEFSPNNDDDDIFRSNHPRTGTISKSIGKTVNYSNVKAIAGQRISLGDENKKSTSSFITQIGENFKYDSASSKKAINESSEMDSRTKLKHSKLQQQQLQRRTQLHHVINENVIKKDGLADVKQQPKRPPRRKHDTSLLDEDNEVLSSSATTKMTNECNGSMEMQCVSSISFSSKPSLSLLQSQFSIDSGTSQKQTGIKSILKKPSSLNLSTVSTSFGIEKDTKNCLCNTVVRNDSLKISNSDKTSSISTNIKGETKCNDKTSGSQFYLPLPSSRKKVQFMVEDKIILDDTEENKILEGNEKNVTKATIVTSKIIMTHNGQDRIISIKQEQQQDKQQEILELLQKGEKSETEIIVGSSNSGNNVSEISKNNENCVVGSTVGEMNETQFESLSKLMVNGKSVPASSGGDVKGSTTENCVLMVIKQEKDTNLGRQLLSPQKELSSTEDVDESMKQSSIPKKQSSLRRTLSDRRSNTTTIILNFNDTMALRAKNIRVKSRDLFSEDEQQNHQQLLQHFEETNLKLNELKKLHHMDEEHQQQSVLEPKNDFPSEIVQNTVAQIKVINDEITVDNRLKDSSGKQNETQKTAEQQHHRHHQMAENPQLSRPFKEQPQQQPGKKICWQDDGVLMIKNDSNTSSGWDKENAIRNVGNISEDFCSVRGDLNITKQSSVSVISDNTIRDTDSCTGNINSKTKLKDQQHQENLNYQIQDNIVSDIKKTVNDKDKEKKKFYDKEIGKGKEKLSQAQNEIYNGARLFGNQNPCRTLNSQKTVVRVAPFNKTSSEIHRLKIQHQDDNHVDDNIISQKKTSILINGDDCYSTVNVNNDTPIYQSSVVVTDGPKNTPSTFSSLSSCVSSISSPSASPLTSLTENRGVISTATNTVTISVSNSSNRTPEEDIIYKNNKINTMLSQNVAKSVIPIVNEEGISNMMTTLRNDSNNDSNLGKGVRTTLITLDYDEKDEGKNIVKEYNGNDNIFSHEEELVKILRNPVEAVKRNLVPHVCGKSDDIERGSVKNEQNVVDTTSLKQDKNSFIGKLLQDSTLSQLAEGLDGDVVAKLIENSLKRLKDSRNNVDTSGTKDNDDMTKLIDACLQKIKEERQKLNILNKKSEEAVAEEQESQSNRGSISSGNSYSSANYELFDFENNESDCYQSCSSEITGDDDVNPTRNKFYQMLVDATLSEIEISTNNEDDHHYESIRVNGDPIYEEISEVPPPLPLSPPPINDAELEKKNARSMFEGASKYDILSYLVDAKERGLVREESYEYNFSNTSDIIVEEEMDTLSDLNKKQIAHTNSRISHLSITSDSSEDTSLTSSFSEKTSLSTITSTTSSALMGQQPQQQQRKPTSDVERNDSGVGSETSKSSRSKYQNSSGGCVLNKNSPIHLCEDCDGPVETQITDSGVMYAPLVCRKCGKKRAERKEIITEIVETEEKYGRDLQIILEEFCQPMFVAGLLTQEQLSAIFLNTEELLENNQALAERMRDALDIALEQGDDDLLTVNVGKIFLECTPMLHAFESYCVRQAAASLLLANLEKEKELLRIFLRVSQMENTVLRRMNLNSFLMVPVQRVTKYPLLLARLFKVTPPHLEGRDLLKQAQEKIELHLNHMNQEAKDVPTKLWRRISSSSPNRRTSCEIDMINIKLRKMAIDVLEWNHDEVRFSMEGKLLFTQPTDSNWKKGRTIKLTPVNALLVTNGKPSSNYKAEKIPSDQLNFPKHTGVREAALLLVKEKCGRYTLIREPLYLDRCVICTEADWDDYFEVHEISSKDTLIFKAEDGVRSKQWYTQVQYHAQGMGAWRKRRNALANIMINGMLTRT